LFTTRVIASLFKLTGSSESALGLNEISTDLELNVA